MSLALMGFTLQSFPLESSITLSSNAITYLSLYSFSLHKRCCQHLWSDSQTLRTRRYVRPNKYALRLVLIRSQVRAHPALVLPSTGGRYSLGLVVSSRENYYLIPALRAILSCTLSTPASRSTLYFRVLRINQLEHPPKRTFIPYRLCTLPHPQDLSGPVIGLIGSPHVSGYLTALCTQSVITFSPTGVPCG